MNSSLDCVPCFARQALEAARAATDDEQRQEAIVRAALRAIADGALDQPPPAMAQRIHRALRALTGDPDPYREIKAGFQRMALDMLPVLRREVAEAADPLAMAVRIAIAGNVIDLGAYAGLSPEAVRVGFGQVLREPVVGDVDALRAAIGRARRILYLADNAGEIVLDRLLVEQLPLERVILATRGAPVLNDATLAEAREAGLDALVALMDNGSDAPGTELADCSEAFLERFREADLIIAKGQGNFESLSHVEAPIAFLLKVKCPLAAEHAGLPVGTHALIGPR